MLFITGFICWDLCFAVLTIKFLMNITSFTVIINMMIKLCHNIEHEKSYKMRTGQY